jgi:serine phosphatase RsbU (regulator of sigma subunit)/tetratricopeptide (TPR) repeat protein
MKNLAKSIKKLLQVSLLFFGTVNVSLYAQTLEIDSLKTTLVSLKGNKKVDVLNKLSLRLINSDPRQASEYVNTALSLAQKQEYIRGTADSYNIIGTFHHLQGNYPKALNHYLKSLEVYQKNKDLPGQAATLLNIGALYQSQGDFKQATSRYEQSLKIERKLGNTLGIANCYINMGNAYSIQKNYNTGIRYLEKALNIYTKENSIKNIATCLNNMANIYDDLQDYPQALKYYQQALSKLEKIDNKIGVSVCLANIANIYRILGENEEALEYALQSFEVAQSIGSKDDMKNAAFTLSQIYAMEEDYARAYQYLNVYLTWQKMMFNEENVKKIAGLQATYDIAQKENEIALLAKENELKQFFIYAILVGLILAIGLLGFAFWAYKQKIKSNKALETQKEVIENKNQKLEQSEQILRQTNQQLHEKSEELASSRDILEKQNLQIADTNKNMRASISYAQRIQEALLPPLPTMKTFFSDWVVFYEPKDIVSGDFYWYAELEGIYYIAAVDCTGHGVPGAFMSMIGHAFLNQILKIQNITEPGDILNKLHDNVRQALHHDTARRQDGMEMVLCAINPDKKEIKFAGAVTPMLMFEKKGYRVLMGERQSIGGSYNFRDEDVPFATQTISYESPTMLYMFSDGYQDQFGGERGRKFSKARFYELLETLHTLPVGTQYDKLKNNFLEWQKDNNQIDDVMVIGLKL